MSCKRGEQLAVFQCDDDSTAHHIELNMAVDAVESAALVQTIIAAIGKWHTEMGHDVHEEYIVDKLDVQQKRKPS